jgi:serine phosphatase RsbU (regulator of sigma subunit)
MAVSRPARRKRVLSIQQIFLLLAILNGIVLSYLIYSASTLLSDPRSSQVQAQTTIFLAVLLVIGVTISYRILSLRVVEPLSRLARQAYAIASSDTNELLTLRGNDEIGRLTEAFNAVLIRQRHAYDLVDSAHQRLKDVTKQVDDSIQYAALLQKSILPNRQLRERFGNDHFILWQPRDTVGGDYYVFHEEGGRCLAGVADCAGHGVSGAMMTMLARAGIDRSIQLTGISSPAAVLQATNEGMHSILSEAQLSRAIATTMDVGLVLIDSESRSLRFSGAKISLYWSDGKNVDFIKGDNRSLWDRRTGDYHDHDVPLSPGITYYLTTDGFLDQAGGEHGFGLGSDRFSQWILEHSSKPLAEQHEAFSRALDAFKGDHPQRDDITMLSFRFS